MGFNSVFKGLRFLDNTYVPWTAETLTESSPKQTAAKTARQSTRLFFDGGNGTRKELLC